MASYAYGTDQRIEAAMSYDAAGNLTRIECGMADGEATEQRYAVGDYNELLRVRTGDGLDPERPDLSFEYDASGRMQRATLGRGTATVQYDALDRATRVVVDGDPVLEYGYGPDDADGARSEDRRTGGVLVAGPVSPVFGTMESIVYARPRSADFGDIRLDWVCPYETPRPDAAAFGNVFRDVNAIRTACNNTSLGASTVAVDALHGRLRCGDTVFASGIGRKTVTDHCPGCDSTKIDHYLVDGRCTGIPSLGARKTFRLGR